MKIKAVEKKVKFHISTDRVAKEKALKKIASMNKRMDAKDAYTLSSVINQLLYDFVSR